MKFISIFEEVEIAKNAVIRQKGVCDKLEEEYNELIKKVQEYSKSYKTKELYKQYMDRLESCKYKLKQEKTDYLRWQSILNKSASLLSMLSKFDCEKIGPVIAKFISTIENKEYVYHKVLYTEKEVISDRYGIDDDYDDYDAFLISLKENAVAKYEDIKDKTNSRIIPNSIILKLNNRFGSKDTNMNFYDKEGNKTVNIGTFDYVYEFINYIIMEKIKNKSTKISDESLYEMLDKFIESYDIKVPGIKIRK